MATKLQEIIIQALPSVSCPVDMQNIRLRRVWLEKEILKLYDKGAEERILPKVQ